MDFTHSAFAQKGKTEDLNKSNAGEISVHIQEGGSQPMLRKRQVKRHYTFDDEKLTEAP